MGAQRLVHLGIPVEVLDRAAGAEALAPAASPARPPRRNHMSMLSAQPTEVPADRRPAPLRPLAYPPTPLGYCGADETRTLLEYGMAQASDV